MNAERLKKPDELTVRLTLRALPCEVPAIHRLRRLLKMALRSYDMRCESIEEVEPDVNNDGQTNSRRIK